MTPNQPQVTFYRVKDNQSKLSIICTQAKEAFNKSKKLLIIAPSFQAAQFIDTLLWRHPAESFLPHVISDTMTNEWIAITIQDQANVNQASVLFNLRSTATPLLNGIQHICEFFDESEEHARKNALVFIRLKG